MTFIIIANDTCFQMDGSVGYCVPSNSISIISRRQMGEQERLCAMKRLLG